MDNERTRGVRKFSKVGFLNQNNLVPKTPIHCEYLTPQYPPLLASDTNEVLQSLYGLD